MTEREREVTRVLLVEDDHDLRGLLEAALQPEFGVSSCGTGSEGLRRLRTDRFDVLLTDLGLPDVGGEELVAAARAGGSRLGLVLMSGNASRLEASRALVDAVLGKPSPLEAIKAAVRHAAERALPRR